jgi:DNA-binding response OmpR family regulator
MSGTKEHGRAATEHSSDRKTKRRSALVVSADHWLVLEITRALRAVGFVVEGTRSPGAAVRRLRRGKPDLIIFDGRVVRESDLAEFAPAAPSEPKPTTERIQVGRLSLDAGSRTVQYNRRQTQLTSTECALLLALARNVGQTVSRDELLDSLGDPGRVFDRTIDRHICNLRRKLDTMPQAGSIIVTVHGVGYRLNIKG